ncbi:MarR family transcriptional regulator [Candidatus Pacearchaeota archaeon]|nr:MarR family transcriptional regulator [Candidatus Pacearchaeota archaeon]
MKNRNVGFLVIGIALVIAAIVLVFNSGLKSIVAATCSIEHGGGQCTMYDTIAIQTGVSLAIAGLVFLVGAYLVFVKEDVVTKFKLVKAGDEKKKKVELNSLDKEERALVKILHDSNNAMFQSELVEKSGFDKVKVTRILDRLEGRQFIERKRRGMSNIVILK